MNNNKIDTKLKIEKLTKLNQYLISGSVFCMFSYVILLGLTAANVVTLRTTNKMVDDSKTQLGTVELSYMSNENVMALENGSEVDFSQATNIAYVGAKADDVNSVAIANTNN